MLSSIGFGGQATLKITLLEELLFLHPGPPGEPTEDPWLSGSVTLYLPKARVVKDLCVRLVGKQDIHWPDVRAMESTDSINKEVRLSDELGETLLEKGEHTFEFQILVPSATAPFEKSQYGRVRHTVTATAKGLGKMGTDLVEDKVLYLIPNPGGPGTSRPPPPLHIKKGGYTEEIGPYMFEVKSPFIMVGGLLFCRFDILSPPTDLTIMSIRLRIDQTFTLASAYEPGYVVTPPVDRRTIFCLDNTLEPNGGDLLNRSPRVEKREPHLTVVPMGTSRKFKHLARLPGDEILRPTTIEGVNAGISVQHRCTLEVTFHAGQPEEPAKSKGKSKEPSKVEMKRMTLGSPFDMFSCCCLIASLELPIYSKHDPDPNPFYYVPPCVCGMEDKLLAERHQATLMQEDRGPGGARLPKP